MEDIVCRAVPLAGRGSSVVHDYFYTQWHGGLFMRMPAWRNAF
jgi:hypothetical protein